MKTLIKQSIFLAVMGLMMSSLVFVSCQESSITSESKTTPVVDAAELEAMNPDNFLDPENVTPNIEDLDLEELLVQNNTGFKSVMSSAGDTSTTGFSITDLGTLPGGAHSHGFGINNNSQATGFGHTSSGNRAFMWENNSMQNIGALNSKSYQHSYGQEINNNGQIVGHSYVNGYYHAFSWDASGGMRDLGTLSGSFYSNATSVNDQGQVVGYSHTKSGTRGFIWDEAGGMQNLGTINGSSFAIPLAINNNGVVVGYHYTGSGYHVFTWDATNGFTDLGTLGMTSTSSWHYVIAQDINDLGQIAGYAVNLSGHRVGGFFWDPNTGFQSLGSIPGAGSRFYSYAFGLNNNGQIVGYFRDYRTYRAFVWDADNGMQDLGVLGQNNSVYYNYSIAHDINDKGEIVGRSINANRQWRAVIWDNGVSNNPPLADAGPDQTLECTGALTSATLDGSSSSDPDGDALTYSWTLNGTEIATGVAPSVTLGHGTHTITLTVNDPAGETDTDNVVIDIVDTTPPALAYTVENTELWPPNHKMKIAVSGISITDICDPNPVLSIAVSSNEASNGKGDGNTETDWEIVDNGDGTYDVFVRAERSGNGDGRIYAIVLTGTDVSGNISEEIVEVTVPLNKGNSRRAK